MSGVSSLSSVAGSGAVNAAQSPMVLSIIENQFIQHFTNGFSVIGGYATELFYLLAGLEIVLFGLVWALKQEGGLGLFVFKIFKLAVIFFIITKFPMLLQAVIDGFTKAGYDVSGGSGGTSLFNPAHLWNFSFDASMALMKLSIQAATTNTALSNIYLLLGVGLVLLFALIGAQIILIVSAFYLVSLLALLLIPLGAFFAVRNFLEQAIQQVFKMGARVFALIVILGLGEKIWGQFDLSVLIQAGQSLSGVGMGMSPNMVNNTASTGGLDGLTLMAPLGFFIATLVIWVLCLKLPGLVAEVVGQIGGRLGDEFGLVSSSHEQASPMVSVNSSVGQVSAGASLSGPLGLSVSGAGGSYGAQGVAAATSLSGGGGGGGGSMQVSTNVNVSTTGGSNFGSGLGNLGGDKRKTQAGADVGISRETLNKLKSTFKQAMNESRK